MTLTITVDQAVKRIQQGGVIAMPTETVYGLAADAFNPSAVARVYEIKQRPLHHPLIVHIADLSWLTRLCPNVPALALRLIEKLWPGPVTIVVPKSTNVPEIVTAGLSSVAIRVPHHPLALELLKRAGTPIAAPSANAFGTLSPTCAADIEGSALRDKIDGILDGGPCAVGIESTIISFLTPTPMLLRPGGISKETLDSLLGPLNTAEKNAPAIAPGMLSRHYAPATKVHFIENGETVATALWEGAAVLCFQQTPQGHPFQSTEILSKRGDFREAAVNLFSALRRLDNARPSRILAFAVPESDLGVAINDRLRRAAS